MSVLEAQGFIFIILLDKEIWTAVNQDNVYWASHTEMHGMAILKCMDEVLKRVMSHVTFSHVCRITFQNNQFEPFAEEETCTFMWTLPTKRKIMDDYWFISLDLKYIVGSIHFKAIKSPHTLNIHCIRGETKWESSFISALFIVYDFLL